MSAINPLASIETALNDLRQGRMIILVDSEDRENEGDLVVAAEHATPEAINFMCQYARGTVCFPMLEADFTRLHIPMMTVYNRPKNQAAFGVSIEAAHGVTTGISAHDRARTVQVAIDPNSGPESIVMPGHTFPIKAQTGGVLVRPGHTEGSTDLARLAGCKPAAVICEIMNADGTMSRLPDLIAFGKQHHLNIVSIADLVRYRLSHENLAALGTNVPLLTGQWGAFRMQTFHNPFNTDESFALLKEPLKTEQPCLVRVHSQCLTGDVFGSLRCDCGKQLSASLAQIAEQGGILLYLSQEGRGIGLLNKIKAYALQDQGLDTVEANHHLGFSADERDYGWAAQMLKALGITQVRLLTNNPHKVTGFEGYGIRVNERVPLEINPTEDNWKYLRAKREKLGHLLLRVLK